MISFLRKRLLSNQETRNNVMLIVIGIMLAPLVSHIFYRDKNSKHINVDGIKVSKAFVHLYAQDLEEMFQNLRAQFGEQVSQMFFKQMLNGDSPLHYALYENVKRAVLFNLSKKAGFVQANEEYIGKKIEAGDVIARTLSDVIPVSFISRNGFDRDYAFKKLGAYGLGMDFLDNEIIRGYQVHELKEVMKFSFALSPKEIKQEREVDVLSISIDKLKKLVVDEGASSDLLESFFNSRRSKDSYAYMSSEVKTFVVTMIEGIEEKDLKKKLAELKVLLSKSKDFSEKRESIDSFIASYEKVEKATFSCKGKDDCPEEYLEALSIGYEKGFLPFIYKGKLYIALLKEKALPRKLGFEEAREVVLEDYIKEETSKRMDTLIESARFWYERYGSYESFVENHKDVCSHSIETFSRDQMDASDKHLMKKIEKLMRLKMTFSHNSSVYGLKKIIDCPDENENLNGKVVEKVKLSSYISNIAMSLFVGSASKTIQGMNI